MNEEQIKKMIADDFDNFINERLDSAIIFKYIDNLEKENLKLKEQYCERTDCSGRLGNSKKVEELEKENQKLKEMQCIFLGTGCQNKMKKYKEVIDKVNKLIAENSEKYWIDDEGEPKYLFNEIRDILSEVE